MKSYRGWLVFFAGVVAAGGCAGPWKVRATLPERYTLVREQLVIYSDFPLAAHHRVLEELAARRRDVGRQLALPLSDEPIYVYLFKDVDRFDAFMRLHHPEFSRRRAYFVETDTRLIVYAHWGDRVAEDLRHEVTHGYLHSVVPGLPLWLDEGLAEYFEVGRARQGLNRPHLDLLLARLEQGQWQPDLARLRRLPSAFDMTQADYAEAWAWVHFLLHSRPERHELLRRYLGCLRRDGSAEPLPMQLGRMVGRPEAALIEHVRRMAGGGGAKTGTGSVESGLGSRR
jgi:hypothetical protein